MKGKGFSQRFEKLEIDKTEWDKYDVQALLDQSFRDGEACGPRTLTCAPIHQ